MSVHRHARDCAATDVPPCLSAARAAQKRLAWRDFLAIKRVLANPCEHVLSAIIEGGVDGEAVEHVHWPDAPDMWMPYAPAIKVRGGTTVYLAGVTAAPVLIIIRTVPRSSTSMPRDMAGQAAPRSRTSGAAWAVGATFADVVTADRFVTDLTDQDALNQAWGECFVTQAGHHHRAGGGSPPIHAASWRSTRWRLSTDRRRGDARRPGRIQETANLIANRTARISTAGFASASWPASTLLARR